MININRRVLLTAAAGGAAGMLMPGAGWAQGYPDRDIHYIVGFAPGGTSDNIARLINPGLAEVLGQSVVVENLPGAGGVVAMERLANAEPDGYTVAHTSSSFLTVTPQLMDVPYDPLVDIEPVAQMGASVQILGVNPDLPVETFEELLAYGKDNPGKLTYGSSGVATGNHITIEYLKKATGLDARHIPYKGAGPAIQDLIAGRIAFTTDPAMGPMIEAGKIRAIAAVDARQHPVMTELPSMYDIIDDWNPPIWAQYITVPKGTPSEVKARFAEALKQVVEGQEIKERLRAMSVNVAWLDAEELAAKIEDEYAAMGNLLKEANITLG